MVKTKNGFVVFGIAITFMKNLTQIYVSNKTLVSSEHINKVFRQFYLLNLNLVY